MLNLANLGQIEIRVHPDTLGVLRDLINVVKLIERKLPPLVEVECACKTETPDR